MKKQSEIENLVQIAENNEVAQIVTRLLTNSIYEARKFLAIYKNYETELEPNYNNEYKYCVSIFIQHNIVTDLI